MPELRHFLRSKIHRARVTRVELDYIGSCAIDEDLLDTAGILPYEQVHVWNVNNGERFVTYAIAAPRGTGTVSVNGSAARRAQINDVVIIAKGNHIRHYLNGRLVMDFTDNNPELALNEGILAVQLHAGKPMWTEFKNIRFRSLD